MQMTERASQEQATSRQVSLSSTTPCVPITTMDKKATCGDSHTDRLTMEATTLMTSWTAINLSAAYCIENNYENGWVDFYAHYCV